MPGHVAEAAGRVTQDVHVVQQRVRPAALHELLDHLRDEVDAAGGQDGVQREAQAPGGQREHGYQRDGADDAELHHQPHPGIGPAGQREVVDEPEDVGLPGADEVLVDGERGEDQDHGADHQPQYVARMAGVSGPEPLARRWAADLRRGGTHRGSTPAPAPRGRRVRRSRVVVGAGRSCGVVDKTTAPLRGRTGDRRRARAWSAAVVNRHVPAPSFRYQGIVTWACRRRQGQRMVPAGPGCLGERRRRPIRRRTGLARTVNGAIGELVGGTGAVVSPRSVGGGLNSGLTPSRSREEIGAPS